MPPTKEVEDRVIYYFTALTLVSGIIWGVAWVALLPDNHLEFRVVLSFCLGELVAGSVASYSSWLPAFFAFAVPAMLPLAVQFLMGGREPDILMGILLIVYTLGLSLLALNFKRALRQTTTLQATLGGVELLIGSIFNNLPFPVSVKLLDRRYILVNEMFAERRSLLVEQVLKRTPRDIFDDDIATLIEEQDRRVMETRAPGILETNIDGVGDDSHDYLTIKFPVIDDENVSCTVPLAIDITEQKRTEFELRKSKLVR